MLFSSLAMNARRPISRLCAGLGMLTLAFSPRSQCLAAGLASKTVQIFDVNEGAVLQTLAGHQDHVQSLVFSPDGSLLVSGSRDKTLRLWKAKSP